MNEELKQQLKRLHARLDILYREAHNMFAGMGEYAHQEAKQIMPHFETLRRQVKRVVGDEEQQPATEEPAKQE